MIGRVCKRGDALSLPVLIARSNLIAPVIHVRTTPTPAQKDPRETSRQRQASPTRYPLLAPRRDSPTAVAHACRTCCPPAWWFERCAQNPIPSRTRPLNAPAPMVLCLKARESRSPPGLQTADEHPSSRHQRPKRAASRQGRGPFRVSGSSLTIRHAAGSPA